MINNIPYQFVKVDYKLPELKPEDFGITKYEWVNGYLNVFENVSLSNLKLYHLPFKFGKIDGDFFIYNCPISSLEFSPYEITGLFRIERTLIKDLKYCPSVVNKMYTVGNKFLMDITNAPKFLKYFFPSLKSIKNIEGYPISIIVELSFIWNVNKTNTIFPGVHKLILENKEKFIPLLDDKVGFHQMLMRLDPKLIPYYRTIPPPSKRTIL